ncbi:MAG: hypothetical protein GWO16_14030 [Gammaproteobacteria bacterium]|nr:hypothetical protein [Gammaproteobacteria bacterium]NIR99049.1 hypothetical protein [Gammaproteobacteria bacterium]NIT64672.1 hypothetical protein [Gammaproteobacteria bacterium]NIY33252.1 hypothetical protein [Gammaproteobacteria bacterium]
MKLELVPKEGEKVLSEEEKERLRRRTRPIPPQALHAFSEAGHAQIKDFLARFLVLMVEIQRDREHDDHPEYYEQHIEKLETLRAALFEQSPPEVARFIELLQLCPMEPWKEIESLLDHLRRDELWRVHRLKHETGIEAALDNPFLMQQDDGAEEERQEQQIRCRMTADEIDTMVHHFSVEDLANQIINARRVTAGDFWESGYYDL